MAEDIQESKSVVTNDFGRLVAESRVKWESEKSTLFQDPLQNIKIPDFLTRNLTSTIVNNLPDYIPANLKQNLIQTHPSPLIVTGIVRDKRMHEELEVVPRYPEWITDESDKASYENGFYIVNEAATDYLTVGIASKIGSKHAWFKPMDFATKMQTRYIGGLKSVNTFFDEKGVSEVGLEDLRQSLAIANLSGDTSAADQILNEMGWGDLNRFTLEVGREIKYTSGWGAIDSLVTNQRLKSLAAGGTVSINYPGIIFINATPAIIGTGNMAALSIAMLEMGYGIVKTDLTMAGLGFALFVADAALGSAVLTEPPVALVHEMAHYLSLDVNRWAYRKIERLQK